MTHRVRLSKSRFLSGAQCYVKLWHDFHALHLAEKASDVLEVLFETSYEVGELACRRDSGGHLIRQDHHHIEEALDDAPPIIAQGTASRCSRRPSSTRSCATGRTTSNASCSARIFAPTARDSMPTFKLRQVLSTIAETAVSA